MATGNLSAPVQVLMGRGRLVPRAGMFSFNEIAGAMLTPEEPELGPFRIDGTICIHLLQKKTPRRPYRKRDLPNRHRADLIEDNSAGAQAADKCDRPTIRCEDARFRAGCLFVRVTRSEPGGDARRHVSHTNAVVHHVCDRTSVCAPGERRPDVPGISCQLTQLPGGCRNKPQLGNASVVAHETGNLRTVGRSAQPVSLPLDPGKFPIGRERQPALNGATRWRGHSPLGAFERTGAGLRDVFREVSDENF